MNFDNWFSKMPQMVQNKCSFLGGWDKSKPKRVVV